MHPEVVAQVGALTGWEAEPELGGGGGKVLAGT